MTLVMEISKLIAQSASELFVWLEENYNVDISESTAKWSELTGMNVTIRDGSDFEEVKVKTKKSKESKKIPKIKESDLQKELCQHILQSGTKTGEQCPKKPRSGLYCSAHKKLNTKTEEAPKKKQKEVNKEIDVNFESDDNKKKKTKKPVEVKKTPKETAKKEKAKVKPKSTSKTVKKPSKVSPSKEESDNSDSDNSVHDEEAIKLLKELRTGFNAATGKKIIIDTDQSDSDSDDEPTLRPTSLLSKQKSSAKYDTDDEKLDSNLNLSEEE